MRYFDKVKGICGNCKGKEDIKFIPFLKCKKCGEQFATYNNGIDVCYPCAREDDICRICGNKLKR